MHDRPTGARRFVRAGQGFALLFALAPFLPVAADEKPAAAPPSRPTANYKLAAKYSLKNIAPMIYDSTVVPAFIGKTDNFWYRFRTSKGTKYWRVEPARKSKAELFDHEKLSEQLAELSRKPVEATSLNLLAARVNAEGSKFLFVFSETQYEYDLKDEKLVSRGKAPVGPPSPFGGPFTKGGGRKKADADDSFDLLGSSQEEPADDDEAQQRKQKGLRKGLDKDKTELDKTKGPGGPGLTTRAMSPDRKMVLFTKDNNLFISEAGKEKTSAKQLTKDGAADYTFSLFGGFNPNLARGPLQVRSLWSKDSKFFYATRQDTRKMGELFLVDSLATPRPRLERYPYSMPGEEHVRKAELHVGTRDASVLLRVAPKWKDESYTDIHWGKKPGELRFARIDRLIRNFELCALDVATGKCTVLIKEGFENAPVDYASPRYLEESDEMLWWSERTGWAHFYLYDRDGKRKNAVTSGAWRASALVDIDEKNRVLYLRGNAREKGENVYYRHLYSVKFDGTGLTLLDPGDADHSSTLSPSREYVVDNASRVDKPPTCTLRDSRGNVVMELETCDTSRLTAYGWRPPETFSVKAADGVTELYGNMWKPFDFDPKKKYPIIAYVYPGPQTEGVTHTFAAYSRNMQLAQVGFIVIEVGHRGGTPNRSKAYHSYGYFNLRDYGLEDKKHAIEVLAARFGFIDISKVGIFGHSGGGFMTAAAMMQRPYNEFFKAGVASAGNHDNNIYNNWWSERHHGIREVAVDTGKAKEKDKDKKGGVVDKTRGPAAEREPVGPPPPTRAKAADKSASEKGPPVGPPPPNVKFEIRVPTNAELAANLKGRLMLVHGDMDNNVHPANTIRLADALIKANKRFDLVILPGQRHGFGSATTYFNRKMFEFFAEHLLGDRREGADMTDNGE